MDFNLIEVGLLFIIVFKLLGGGRPRKKARYNFNRKTESLENNCSQNEFTVIMGSVDQSDDLFCIENRGKQCTPISCVAVTYFYHKDIDTWNSHDIDTIVHIGDQLYTTSQNAISKEINTSYEYLTFDEVFNTVHLHGDTFTFLEDIESDNIRHIEQGICTVNNLIASLRSFFDIKNYTTGIFTCNNYSFAVMKFKLKYYFFDSHKRNSQGYPALGGKGAAILCCITTLQCLANYLLSNCLMDTSDYNCTANKFFSLMSIRVTQNPECVKVKSTKHTRNVRQTKKVT